MKFCTNNATKTERKIEKNFIKEWRNFESDSVIVSFEYFMIAEFREDFCVKNYNHSIAVREVPNRYNIKVKISSSVLSFDEDLVRHFLQSTF